MAISGEDVAGRGGEEHATAQASLLRLFRLALLTQARSLKRYPPVSRAQAEEGVSRVRVAWYAEERRFAITVEHSSWFARLDVAAEALLEAATRRAFLPPALAAADFSLTVPIMFRLDEP
jgi:TonB family protein